MPGAFIRSAQIHDRGNSGKLAFCHSFDLTFIYTGGSKNLRPVSSQQREWPGASVRAFSSQLTGLTLIPSGQCCDATEAFTIIDHLPLILSRANIKDSVTVSIPLLHILLICHQDYLSG